MDTFSPESKVWIYQADRTLNDEELLMVNHFLQNFCKDWTAHNQQLLAGAEVLYKRFIMLKVDESHTTASGCSIDKSVRALKELSTSLGLDLFNRMRLPYLEGGEIKTVDFNQVEKNLEQNNISSSTEFFDLNVQTLAQFREKFLVPLRQHWAYPKV